MNQFGERKGIKREFSIAKTHQQNGVAERKNRTLIKAVRIMLADSKLHTTFWAEAVNTICYVQNRVSVTKSHNKTPYEFFLSRKPALGFMRLFGCHVTILNTIDHLGKFDGKVDEGFFVGYSINSKAFRSMNYKPVVAGNQSNGNVGTKACDDAGKARMETVPGDDEKKVTKEPGKEGGVPSKEDEKDDQVKEADINNTNSVYTVSSTVNIVGSSLVNDDGSKFVNVVDLPDDPNMPPLEDIIYSDVGSEADMNNLDALMPVSPIPNTRVNKDHRKNPKRTQKGNSSIEGSKLDRGYAGRASTIQVTRRYIQEEGIDYDEVFALVARIEAIRLFLAYVSFKDFMVYQMDVKSAFLYGKIEEEVYVCQPPGLEDPDFPDRVYKVDKALYGLHQAPRA
ncbi:retrovirus-related pol polyprotein from transposon TNT 1-94, partial [Tanacetum coccineum]